MLQHGRFPPLISQLDDGFLARDIKLRMTDNPGRYLQCGETVGSDPRPKTLLISESETRGWSASKQPLELWFLANRMRTIGL